MSSRRSASFPSSRLVRRCNAELHRCSSRARLLSRWRFQRRWPAMTSYIRIYPPSVTSRHCSNKNRAPLVHSYIQFKSRSHKWLMGACQCMGWQIHMLRIFSLQAHRTPCVAFPLFFALLYFRFLFVNDPAMANISLYRGYLGIHAKLVLAVHSDIRGSFEPY